MYKFALCVIAKDNRHSIIQMLDSTLDKKGKPVFDLYCLNDTGSTDNTVKLWKRWCKKYKVKSKIKKSSIKKDYSYVTVNGTDILADFAKAREDSFKLARKEKADFAFWLDTDDVLEGAGNLRKYLKLMKEDKTYACFMTYDYAVGPAGEKLISHKREKIINLAHKGKWSNRVHENYKFADAETKAIRMGEVSDAKLVHKRTGGDVVRTGRRNHLIMKLQEDLDGLKSFTLDLLNSYAYDHWEHGEWKDALRLYKIFLKRIKNKPNQGLAQSVYLKMGVAYKNLGQFDNAMKYAFKSVRANVSQPHGQVDGRVLMMEVNAEARNWTDASYCANKVLQLGPPKTTAPINEMDYTVKPLIIKATALAATGMLKDAIRVLTKGMQKLGSPHLKKSLDEFKGKFATQQAVAGFANILKYLQLKNRADWADRLLAAIPISLRDDETIRALIRETKTDYKRKTLNIRLQGPKTIHLWAGPHYEPWDGNSDVSRGIGGSEGMTIQLMRGLAKLGNKVTVFNECGPSDGKVFEGVTYVNWGKWSPRLEPDVFISLRSPQIFNRIFAGKKHFLWLHDTYYGDIETTLFHMPTRVIALSEAHKKILQQSHQIEDSAFWITRNALNPIAMQGVDEVKKEPHRVIYASSYDRGLDNALKDWPKVRAVIPDAELHIFYGWNTYDSMMQSRKGTPAGAMMQEKKQELLKMMEQPGVIEHGRVTQLELYKEFAKARAWYYPSSFYEISCINAMTSQACSCIPVCTTSGALKETVIHGLKVPLNQCAEALIEVLQNPNIVDVEKMKTDARMAFDMGELAKQWDNFFTKV